ncbi:MAG: hypothetical protein ABI479_07900 [Gallionella sp.]
MNSIRLPGDHPGSDPSDKLPVLTQVADPATTEILPTLTEIIAKTDPHSALGAKEQQLILQQLEQHIETLLSQKLVLRLEQLQRQAVKQAVSELRAELPKLLRDALKAHLESRQLGN